MMSWLVNFTGEVLPKYKVHANGRTSYEMTTGHRWKQTVCGFGERVHFKTTTEKTRKNKMDTEWDVGFYLGSNPRTTEYLVANEAGVISCTTIRRMPDENAYDKSCLEAVLVGHRDYVCNGASSTNPRIRLAVQAPVNHDPSPISGPAIPRRMRINPADVVKYGFTIGCQGCEAVQLGSDVRRNHSDECRSRIEKEIEETEGGKKRLQRAKGRMDQWTHDQTAVSVGPQQEANAEEMKAPEETLNTGGASGSGGAQDAFAMTEDIQIDNEVELEDKDRRRSDRRLDSRTSTSSEKI